MDEVKEALTELSKLVHHALRALKIGDSGTISCSRKFPEDDVRAYAMAYALHKGKWFTLKYDPIADVLNAKRVPVPNWERVKEIDIDEVE